MIRLPQKALDDLAEVMGRQFVRYGRIKEIDVMGDATGNVHHVKPAVKILVKEHQGTPSPWLRVWTSKNSKNGTDYIPPDVDEDVAVLCPGGVIEQGYVVGVEAGIPDHEALKTEDNRLNRRVWLWGKLLFYMDRTDGQEELMMMTPNGHMMVIRDEVDKEGILLMTGDKNLVGLTVGKDAKVTVQHKTGTTLEMDASGAWNATVKGDRTALVSGDDTETIKGDKAQTIEGKLTCSVTGQIEIRGNAEVKIGAGTKVTVEAGTEIELKTASGPALGVMTQGTMPVCPATGEPLSFSLTVKGSA